MRLTLSTNFEMDTDNHAEVRAALPNGRVVMTVRIDFLTVDQVSYSVHDAELSHPSLVRVMLAASDLIDSFFTDAESVYEVEV